MAVKQPKGKIVRRLGVNIFGNPKYSKLLDKKPNGPGKVRGAKSRGKMSVYGEQLKEKQKFRFAYGMSERQFRNLFAKAQQMKGVTGDNMLSLMEQRLDNTIYRMGFAISRAQARQMVSHAYFLINGKPANIPSMRIKANDVITSKDKKGIQNLIRHNLSLSHGSRGSWLAVDEENLSATVSILPSATDIQPVGNIQYVVEYYSR
ncbi:30S ribosomal protein S4 [Treponema phagedenis]|uniref:Small ribosomal subunit protein uS4 n=1 Tax=Treponema phagedenis TaxID=162 RepID=A0A0B7GZT0_TREPH|nr:30S ribosomal protein S4 [Treponema phagedenis]NVP23721.1 30S ribosomal protein S4 [Treponema phagedenis]QEJ94454.1 30S ribosomal protein S4 [Treponema phagedenis]QEJ97521.1 30S ribosomal protein S4 [Treponema phagedenis]QEK01665.1 30S ribosomal protein S4 [Treponema phagedenis]QEK03088.1 30S ribosomal protein S4 [Treponema phagedenis]